MDTPTALPGCELHARAFRSDVLAGLHARPKRLPSKYFYDAYGAELFDRICQLEEYYLTRAELDIMDRFAPEMRKQIGPGAVLVELGSGSSQKTRRLLEGSPRPVAYVPVDISEEHLARTARALARDFPQIEIAPLCADFTQGVTLPPLASDATHTAVYFPGSTVGNFTPVEETELLRSVAALCGPSGCLLVGIDLKKDIRTIEAAYNDSQGVTAAFNLNLLRRINRELGANFDLRQFSHRAFYHRELGRVEMHLVSCRQQEVTVASEPIPFSPGETIRTEISYKYTPGEFAAIASPAGFRCRQTWTDRSNYFAVLHFTLRP